MDVAFIHPNSPNAEGTGATHSATLIVDIINDICDNLTIYCSFDNVPENSKFNCRSLNTRGFPYHSKTNLNADIRNRIKEFEKFDLVHSYLPSTIPAMDTIARSSSTTTVVSLNAYGGICPKNDLQYKGQEKCNGNSYLKCFNCSIGTNDTESDHGQAYWSASLLGNLRLIQQKRPSEIKIDGFQALSEHVKKTYSKFGYPEDRISVIPNVLDESFCIDHKSGFSEPYKLLYVGQLKKNKGVDRFPEILSYANKRLETEFTLTIVGDGPLRKTIKTNAKKKGVLDLIDFSGYIENSKLPSIYANHDLFVYPGVWDEPFGRVFIEALAAGTPVVSTNIGAVKEIVGKGGIVTETNPTSLAKEIVYVLENDQLESLSEHAFHAVKSYRHERVKLRFKNLYNSLGGNMS